MSPIEIKELRTKLGLSQEKLARLIGVSYGSVQRWEKGKCKPSDLAMISIKKLMEGKK